VDVLAILHSKRTQRSKHQIERVAGQRFFFRALLADGGAGGELC
jgi:hypothetical protein